jgi:shikimate kinase
MMGCGKSTVAEALSKKYNLKKVDTDEIIVERYGCINDIFANFGEEHFRNIESDVTKEVSEKFNDAVISLGGGCVLRPVNVTNLKKSGKIIFLRTDIETLVKRLEGDDTRPLLKGGARQKLTTLLPLRTPIYEGVADYIIDTDGLLPEEIATKIMEHIK